MRRGPRRQRALARRARGRRVRRLPRRAARPARRLELAVGGRRRARRRRPRRGAAPDASPPSPARSSAAACALTPFRLLDSLGGLAARRRHRRRPRLGRSARRRSSCPGSRACAARCSSRRSSAASTRRCRRSSCSTCSRASTRSRRSPGPAPPSAAADGGDRRRRGRAPRRRLGRARPRNRVRHRRGGKRLVRAGATSSSPRRTSSRASTTPASRSTAARRSTSSTSSRTTRTTTSPSCACTASPRAPLPLADPKPGAAGRASSATRRTGRSSASPGRVGRTGVALTQDAYGNGRSRGRSLRSRGTRAARRLGRPRDRCERSGARRRSSRRASARPAATACRRPSCAACSTPPAPRRSRPVPAPRLIELRQEVDDVHRRAERRDRRTRPARRSRAASSSSCPSSPPDLARVRARARGSAPARARGRRCPGTSLCTRTSVSIVRIGKTPTRTGIGQPPTRSRNASSGSRSKRICVIANCAPASTLRWKRSASRPRSSAVGLTATPGKNDVGASIARPWWSSPRFSRASSSDEADRVDLVHAAAARVVAGLGRVAGDGEDVPNALRVRAEQDRLEPGQRHVARRQVRDRLDAGEALDRDRGHDPAHARAGARVVVHVDELRLVRVADGARRRDERLGVRAERRVELHRDDELALVEQPLRASSGSLVGGRPRRLARVRGRAAVPGWRGAVVDRRADRRDLRGRRAAAAADDAARRGRAPAPRTRRSTRASRAGRRCAGRTCSRGRRSGAPRARAPSPPICASAFSAAAGPGAVVRAERRDVERAQPLGRRLRADTPASVSPSASNDISATIGSARHRADRRDRRLELVEVEERLDHEEVGAAALEHRAPAPRTRALASGPDRAGDEDLAPGHLARLAREPHGLGVDPLELVLEEAPARASAGWRRTCSSR